METHSKISARGMQFKIDCIKTADFADHADKHRACMLRGVHTHYSQRYLIIAMASRTTLFPPPIPQRSQANPPLIRVTRAVRGSIPLGRMRNNRLGLGHGKKWGMRRRSGLRLRANRAGARRGTATTPGDSRGKKRYLTPLFQWDRTADNADNADTGEGRFRRVAAGEARKSSSECDDGYQIALCVMYGEISKDGSPEFIRMISGIRGFFKIGLELHNTCRNLQWTSLKPHIPCHTTLRHTLIYCCKRAPEPEIASATELPQLQVHPPPIYERN